MFSYLRYSLSKWYIVEKYVFPQPFARYPQPEMKNSYKIMKRKDFCTVIFRSSLVSFLCVILISSAACRASQSATEPSKETSPVKPVVEMKAPDASASPAIVADDQKAATDPEKAWKPFLTSFRAAVKKQNVASLKTMMVKSFEYVGGTIAPEEFLEDFEDDEDWGELQKTVALEDKPYAHPTSKRPSRIIKNLNPCGGKKPCKYELWAVFEFGEDNQWRWTAYLAPEKK